MKIKDVIEITRCFGLRYILHWVFLDLRLKSGWYRWRLPTRSWDEVHTGVSFKPGVPREPHAYVRHRRERGGKFFFAPGKPPPAATLVAVAGEAGKERVLEIADACCEGRLQYFSDRFGDLGRDVDWLCNPFTGARVGAGEHWSRGGFFSPATGDVKFIWEPSRFAWVFWLVKAYALTGDHRYADRFWVMLESWMETNPPQQGPNWQSGQEAALRSLAVCFATHAFFDAPSTTPERLMRVTTFLAEHAVRVAAHIGDAIRQKNNHALSEACALWTIGLLYPELQDATRWRLRGRQVLEQEMVRQVYDDGSYVQQSMNYHRVMLQILAWAARIGEINDRPLDKSALLRFDRAGQFLHAMLDEHSGQVPNYGHNDGALVLPLDSCAYRDYRPTVQLARYAVRRQRTLDAGPWDEPLVWMYGQASVTRPPVPEARDATRYDAGGYYLLRSRQSWCMIRCHSYQDRPAHIDPLHVDLWWQGVNVFRDAGTFQYYTPERPALKRYFGSIGAHNTIEIDGVSPARAVGQFVDIPWPRARVIQCEAGRWQGEHTAYRRKPWDMTHRRAVEVLDETSWLVTDELLGSGVHTAVLRWHMPLGEWTWSEPDQCLCLVLPHGEARIHVEGPAGYTARVLRGDPECDSPPALESSYYGRLAPQLLLEVECTSVVPMRFVTRLTLTPVDTRPAEPVRTVIQASSS